MNSIFCRLGFTAAMVVGLSVTATPALAWDGAVTGKVAQIDLAEGGTNFGFRVTLENNPLLCTGGSDWAYINSTSTNYQAIASALMLAYSSGKPVTLYTNRDTSNYCKLGYVVLKPSP